MNKSELVQQNNVATPTTLLEMAINKGVDVDQLEKLMAMQERYDAKMAKAAFLTAVTKFQSIVPRITKSKSGHNYKYAPLADIVEQIKDELSECGISYRFEQNHTNGIEVSCVISHIEGHSERTTMSAAPDTSGSKNDVQAIGSTVQYLQRYTLIGALGLTTADEDMDGRLPFEGLSDDQMLTIEARIKDTEGDLAKFLKWKNVESLNDIRSSDYQSCLLQIDAAYKARIKK